MDYLKKHWYWILGIYVVILAILPTLNTYLAGIGILIFVYVSLAISWNVITGFTGLVSFGHAAFFGLGAYLPGLMLSYYNISPLIGMLIAGIVSSLLSVVIGLVCFRLKGIYFALSTFCFALILEIFARHFKNITGGDNGLQIPIQTENSFLYFQFADYSVYYVVISLIALLFFCISALIYHSKFGYYLRAVRDDDVASESIGINVKKTRIYAYAISAFMASVVGTFYIQYTLYIDPATAFGMHQITQIMLPTILGGIGTLVGPVIGAVFTVGLTQGITAFTSTLNGIHAGLDLIIYSVIVILVVSFIPQGIVSVFSKKRRSSKTSTESSLVQTKFQEGGGNFEQP